MGLQASKYALAIAAFGIAASLPDSAARADAVSELRALKAQMTAQQKQMAAQQKRLQQLEGLEGVMYFSV